MKHKRLLTVFLAVMMAAALPGCGGKDSADSKETSELTSAQSTDTESTSAETENGTDEIGGSSANGAEGTDDGSSKNDGGSENSKSESSGSAEQGGSSGSETDALYQKVDISQGDHRDDFAGAYRALGGFLNGWKNNSRDDILKYTDLDQYIDMMALMYRNGFDAFGDDSDTQKTPEEIHESLLDEMFEGMEEEPLKSYTVLRSAFAPHMVKSYNENLDEMRDEIKEKRNESDLTEEDKKQIEQAEELLRIYPSIDKVYIFDTELNASEKKQDYLYCACVNGKWQVSLGMISPMSDYLNKARITSANSAAKSVHIAGQSALTDMDAEDRNIKLLEGTYTFKGSDFSGLTEPADGEKKEDLLRILKYNMYLYFNDIVDLEQISFSIKSGSVECIAVQKGTVIDVMTGNENPLFGTYPNYVPSDGSKTFKTLDEALTFAKRTDG